MKKAVLLTISFIVVLIVAMLFWKTSQHLSHNVLDSFGIMNEKLENANSNSYQVILYSSFLSLISCALTPSNLLIISKLAKLFCFSSLICVFAPSKVKPRSLTK